MSRAISPGAAGWSLGWKARRRGPQRGSRVGVARIPCASLLLSAAAATVFLLPSLAAELQYGRAAIAAGEVWRLFSGHWTHYSFDHFFWDLLAFGALGVVCEGRSRSRFLFCVIASTLAISLTVWFCLPGMSVYRGLSGVDSALFGLLFAELWREAVRSGRRRQFAIPAACLSCFLFKISFELVTGNNLFVGTLGSGTVGVPLAHIVGAVVGLLVGLSPNLRRRFQRFATAGAAIPRSQARVTLRPLRGFQGSP